MKLRFLLLACLPLLAAPGALGAQPTNSLPRTVAQHQAPPGYLTPEQLPDTVHLLGPPPQTGSGTKLGDVATYWSTRRLKDSPRWALAARDAEFGASALLDDFSCALGVQLNAHSAPWLVHLLERVVADSEAAQSRAKNFYRRPRPFIENGGPICVPEENWLRASYSYPSGHSTFSWTSALILAELFPKRSTQILARARVYAESRVVCGVHYSSDIEAGRVAGTAVFSALNADKRFRADLDHARAEINTLRRTAQTRPNDMSCRVEADAIATPIW